MTIVQEIFSELEKIEPSLFDIHSEKGRNFINRFHNFLELEKSQMKESYNAGFLKDKYNDYSFEDWFKNFLNK
jgi:hypothetical protein